MKLSREVKTGIFAIVSILLFLMGYSYLKGADVFEKSRVYYVKYPDVSGLANAAPVTINGMKVGKVRDIFLSSNKGGQVIVEFVIEKEFYFSKTSLVQIYSSGLIGGNNIRIIPDYKTQDIAVSGDTLTGKLQAGMIDGIMDKFTPLEKVITRTVSSLDSVLVDLNEVMDERTKNNLREGISKLNQTMTSFNGVAANLNSLLATNKDKLTSTFTNLDETSENFARFSDSLSQIETGKMMRNLEDAVAKFQSIAEKIESGDGSVGKLLNDEKLYDNLTGASKQLEQLLEDMKLNPKRYVHFSLFGKRPKQYEPPKDTVQ